jgi:ABC-2 type transport system ATP-binding protein
MWEVITELAAEGATIFLTTQYLEEADRLADRIAVLDRGVVVAEGTSAELKQQVGGQRLDLILSDGEAFARAARILDGRATMAEPKDLAIGVATDGSAAGVRALLDEVDPERTDVRTFAVHGVTLDDVFLALTGRPAEQERQEIADE